MSRPQYDGCEEDRDALPSLFEYAQMSIRSSVGNMRSFTTVSFCRSWFLKATKLKEDQSSDATPGKDRVVYHDSCYLGRYNEIYEPQRDIIDALPDVERVEADRSRQIGLCCGAGGGQMWMEMNIGERMNYVRTDELLEKKPKVIAVACNFCMTMMDDGVKARGKGEEVEVLDLAELLDRRID